jgi:hypothetical protein
MGDGVDTAKNIPAVPLWNNRPDETSGNIAEDVACGVRDSMKMKAGPLQRLCRRAGPLRGGHRRQIKRKPPVAAVIAAKLAAGSGRGEDTRPALKAAAADPAGTFTAAAAEAGEEDDGEELPPALKAAAADLTGSFTAAAAEAGGDDEAEEPPAALKAATADPRGAFTAVAAEAGGTAPGGQGVSATMLLTPATWRMSEVYSATYERWRACLAVHGSETLLRA